MSNKEILLLFLNLDLGGFAYILQSNWVGIITIQTERTQIDFLCNVLILLSHRWILKSLL